MCVSLNPSSGEPGLPIPRDCKGVYERGCKEDGVYTIDPGCPDKKPFDVFCDMKNGRWIVFQSRMDGSENFYRGWLEYVNGFGQLKGEHWLGLEKIHCLTTRRPRTQLRVDLADFNGVYKYAYHYFFSVGNKVTNYRLNVAGYTGTAGNALSNHNGMAFSTKDRDNDKYRGNCAVAYSGAGWFRSCFSVNLNGRYLNGATTPKGVVWHTFSNSWRSLKFAQMKLRFLD